MDKLSTYSLAVVFYNVVQSIDSNRNKRCRHCSSLKCNCETFFTMEMLKLVSKRFNILSGDYECRVLKKRLRSRSVWVNMAISFDYLPCIVFYMQAGLPIRDDFIDIAAKAGSPWSLATFHMGRMPWTPNTAILAAKSGNIDCLRYCLDNGCSDKGVSEAAMEAGKLHCIQYLVARRAVYTDKHLAESVETFRQREIKARLWNPSAIIPLVIGGDSNDAMEM